MNYWYVARPNELFIDTDKMSKSLAHTKARLQGAIECGKLDVAYVMQRPSTRLDHCHTIIVLKNSMSYVEKCAWTVILHSDIYRAMCTMMRHFTMVDSPDVLISPHPTFSFDVNYQRGYDDSCDCTTKHNAATMQNCPAAIRLRGDNRTRGLFGRPSKNKCTVWPD